MSAGPGSRVVVVVELSNGNLVYLLTSSYTSLVGLIFKGSRADQETSNLLRQMQTTWPGTRHFATLDKQQLLSSILAWTGHQRATMMSLA